MKKIAKIFYTIAGSLLLLGINSCSEDFLVVDHYDILPAGQTFLSDEDALKGLVGCYDMMYPAGDVDGDNVREGSGDWGIKPNLFIGCHPTMDTQATGWDKDWNVQNWDPSSNELKLGWIHAYSAINRCNIFITGLEAATAITPALKITMDGEARGIRAFFYMWLAKAFGRVPMLATGETYENTPAKARAETYAEMWDFIIEDLKVANEELDWTPYNEQYGRITKGFALSFLGEAYMWKAYKVPAEATANYTLAAAALNEVIEDGPYELNASFTTLWDPGAVWTKESIWEAVFDMGNNFTDPGNDTYDNWTFHTFFTACPEAGGWGTLYLSWEWWSCYEPGDKRREASGVTGAVAGIDPAWQSATNYGYHPYLQQTLASGANLSTHYHYNMGGEAGPSIWSLKTWRTTRAQWIGAMHSPQQVYYKRYANVLLDYAECLFRLGGNDAEAWGYIDQIRQRAWGNDEVGKSAALTATYLPYYQRLQEFYLTKGQTVVVPDTYPLAFNEVTVAVPDAETYYTQLKTDKGFDSPVWLVALATERRKEFNAEWCLAPDMIRSGFIEDHITHNYPKGVGVPNSDPTVWDTYNTYRTFDFNLEKMDMPIPTDELLKNPLCDQNEAYQ